MRFSGDGGCRHEASVESQRLSVHLITLPASLKATHMDFLRRVKAFTWSFDTDRAAVVT